jgi:Protein of unknown function (DUF1573)
MKDTIKIALLAIIAGTLIIQTIGQRTGGATSTMASNGSSVAAVPGAAANATMATPDKKTFDPLTPPTAQPVDVGPKTSIAFPVMQHNFGKVKQNTDNGYTFKFTNTGSIPLVISDAKGSCGCTVPDYPKEPIAPGGTGEINVMYKPGAQQGNQSKTVTVTANTEPAQTVLNISADVQVDPNAPKAEGGH